jgi:hypothetical protein
VDAEGDGVLPPDLQRIGLDLNDFCVGIDELPVEGVDVAELATKAQHQIRGAQ